MYCSKCGNELKDGEKFCSKCGTSVESATTNQTSSNPTKKLSKKTKKIIVGIVIVVLIIAAFIHFSSSKTNFKVLYNDYCSSSWATLASDNSYLKLDSNPNDIDDFSLYAIAVNDAMKKINNALGLPESLNEKINNTNSLAGVQNYTSNGITVTWTYHPDNGLELLYEKAK